MFNNDEDDLYSRDAAPPPPKQEPLPVELPADEYVIQHRLPWVDWLIFLYIYKYNNNNLKLSLHRTYLEKSYMSERRFFFSIDAKSRCQSSFTIQDLEFKFSLVPSQLRYFEECCYIIFLGFTYFKTIYVVLWGIINFSLYSSFSPTDVPSQPVVILLLFP